MKKGITIIMLSLVLFASGCAVHRQGGATATAPATATPYETAMMYSTALAQTNDSVIHAVIALQAIQPSPISTADAKAVLVVQQQLASIHQQLAQVLEQGPAVATGQGSEIKTLLDQIKGLAVTTVNAANLSGVKDPNSQAQLTAEIQSIASFADLMVTELTAAGVLKQ